MSIMDTNGEVVMDVVMIVFAQQQASLDRETVPMQGTFRVIEKDSGWPGVRPKSIIVEIVDTAINSADPRHRIKFKWLLDSSASINEDR